MSVDSVDITKYYQGDQIKENERDGSCSTHGGNEKRVQNFSRKISRNRLGELGVDGKIILK
jgi:hypothetical protein